MVESDSTVSNHDLWFCVDDLDGSYVSAYGRVRSLTKDEWQSQPRDPERRCTANLIRALVLAADSEGPACMLCEDDVLCSSRWLQRAQNAVQVLHERESGRFLLALFSAYSRAAFKPHTLQSGTDALLCYENQNDFYGNVCLVMPPGVAEEIAEWSKTAVGAKLVGDQLVKRYCALHGVQIWVTDPSLVDHGGDVSSIYPKAQRRRAANFG